MAEAGKNTDFSGLSYGDETRRNGDYVGIAHSEGGSIEGAVRRGQPVVISGGVIAAASDTSGDAVVGVLSNYPRAGDSGGPSDPAPITGGQPATVKTSGTVKAEVDSAVSAGDVLGVNASGVLDDSAGTSYVALSDAVEDDRDDGTTTHYADVLLR
jgi:hypothetical protein